MSVSQNAHEIADALKAPVSPTIIVRCVLPRYNVDADKRSRSFVASGTLLQSCPTPLPKPY